MSDPLGLIGRCGGAGGAGGVHGPGHLAPPRPQATDPNAPSFKSLLMDNLKQVDRLQQEATVAIEDLQTGKRADLEGVLAATQKADTAFHMLVAVRNKLTAAFEEVKQMRT